MEEKDSAISGPYEEFRICFCGKIPSGFVEWYLIDVSVKEACLSEKTESSTRKLNPFSVAKRLSSYAALGGLIYSLGGQRRSDGGGETLLNDVWLLNFESLEDLKPGSILPQPSYDKGDKGDIGEYWKPDSGKAHIGEYWKPESILPQPSYDKGDKGDIGEYWKPDSGKAHIGEYWKPDSGKAHIGEYWKSNSGKENWSITTRIATRTTRRAHVPGGEDCAFKEPKLETRLPVEFRTRLPVEEPKLETRESRTRLPVEEPKLETRLPVEEPKLETRLPVEEPKLDEDWEESWKENEIRGLKNWDRGLPMNFARYKPHTMVVDHKLYVLGGFLPNQKNQADGWIEVFDPEEKKWESLPSPPDQIHSSIMISGLLKSKKEIIIAKQRQVRHPLFYSYNITTRCWNLLSPPSYSEASVLPNIGRAVTVGNTLYWISTEEDNHECTIRAYDSDREMWFEDHLNTARIFGEREYFSSIYSRGPGFLHLVDQKFCLLLQSSVTKKDPQPSIEYLYCVILDISPIYEYGHEDRGKFELTTVSVQKYSMDHYIDFLDCMLLHRGTGVKSVDHRERSTTQPQFPGGLDQPSH